MKHLEDNIQTACVKWFDYQFPKYRLLLHSSPNGGKRNAREAARFKVMGTRAGFPDLILLLPRHGYTCLAIEMKAYNGRQSEKQKEWQAVAERNGIKYVVCRSFEEFSYLIYRYLESEILA